jgi:hypothetical protein
MPENRHPAILQLSIAAALALSCWAASGGVLGGALSGAANALSDAADEEMHNDALLEQMQLQHRLEMERLQRQFEMQQQLQQQERARRARMQQASLPTLDAWLQTQPPSVRALHGSSKPSEMTLLLDLYRRDLARIGAGR